MLTPDLTTSLIIALNSVGRAVSSLYNSNTSIYVERSMDRSRYGDFYALWLGIRNSEHAPEQLRLLLQKKNLRSADRPKQTPSSNSKNGCIVASPHLYCQESLICLPWESSPARVLNYICVKNRLSGKTTLEHNLFYIMKIFN